MSVLTSNAILQQMGYVKITDGTYLVDVSANGELKVTASSSAPSAIGDGSKTVTTSGTRVALATTTTCKYVIIVGLVTNTDAVWIGGSTVAVGSGIPIVATQSQKIDIDDLSKIYIDSVVSGEGVSFCYVS